MFIIYTLRNRIIIKILSGLIFLILSLNSYSQKPKVHHETITEFNDWVSKTKPSFVYKNEEKLNNFYCYKNIFFWGGH